MLKQNNLQLTGPQIEDLPHYFSIVGDAPTMQWITGEAYSLEEAEEELSSLIKRFAHSPVTGLWLAREGTMFIGVGGLIELSTGEIDFGYRVYRPLWGQGYGYLLAAALLGKARAAGLSKLVAKVERANTASIKILEKLDFKQVGEEGSEIHFAWNAE